VRATCAAGLCRSAQVSGFSAVACVFRGAGLRPPACGGQELPRAIRRLLEGAARLVERASAASHSSQARRLIKRELKTMRRAHKLVTARQGRIPNDCAGALADSIADAGRRSEQWLRTPVSAR
jgi:hypothetical protein